MRRFLHRIWYGDKYSKYVLNIDVKLEDGSTIPVYCGTLQTIPLQMEWSAGKRKYYELLRTNSILVSVTKRG